MPERTSERMVDTPHGPARLVQHRTRAAAAHVLLTHGAGGGIDAADLVALADFLPRQGFAVTRVDMPWRVAGRRIAPRPQVIDECFEAVVEDVGSLDVTDLLGGADPPGSAESPGVQRKDSRDKRSKERPEGASA